jgi:hypothetical protein
MKSIFFLIAFLPFFVFAQSDRQSKKDSIRYYEHQLRMMQKTFYDSVYRSEEYQTAIKSIQRLKRMSKAYGGFAIGSGVLHSDYEKFNQAIAQSGFPPLNANSGCFLLGATVKYKRQIWDIYAMNAAFGSTSRKGDEKIYAAVNNAFEIDLGIDLLRAKRISIFPYGGLSIRFAELRYEAPVQTNPGATNISNLISNDKSVDMNSTRLGYQAGLRIHLIFAENKSHTANKVLFVKGGVNQPVGKDKYKDKSSGVKYDPQINHGVWVINFGIIFGNKN